LYFSTRLGNDLTHLFGKGQRSNTEINCVKDKRKTNMKIVHILSAVRSSIYLILVFLCNSCAEKPNTINKDGAKLVATAKDKIKKESTN